MEKYVPKIHISTNHFPDVLLLSLAILIGVAFFSLAETDPVGPDSIGYVYAGERLASGHGLTYEDANNQLAGPYFSLFAFQIRRFGDPRMFLGFPPGFPILLTLGIVLTGKSAAVHYLVPGLAVIGLIATFHLAKLISNDSWTGIWASVLVALSPTFWQFGTSAWSEMPSLLMVAVGFCFYLWSRQAKRTTWQMVGLSLFGGLLLDYSFFIRYANIFFVPTLVVYELVSARKRIFVEWTRWLFFFVVGLGLLAIPIFNFFYYGGATLTSYSPVHGWYPQPAFSLAYALGPSFVNGYSLIESLKTLWHDFPGLILLVPAGWVLLKRPFGLLVSLATYGTLAIYAVYAFAPTGLNSRFLLPIYPFIGTAIAYTIARTSKQIPNIKWRLLFAVTLLALLGLRIPGYVTDLKVRNANDTNLINRIQEITSSSAPDSVFLSYRFNDPIIYYGNRSVLNYRRIPISDPEAGRYHWEMLEPCLVQTINHLLQNNTSIYYVEDRSPPLGDSLAILQRNFRLELTSESPRIYLINNPLQTQNLQGSERCQP